MPLVSELAVPSSPDRPPRSDPRPPADFPRPVPGSEDRIRSFLRGYVHGWDESKRLLELGLDSLDFVRMRGDFARLFGKDVPLAEIARPDRRLGELYAFLSES